MWSAGNVSHRPWYWSFDIKYTYLWKAISGMLNRKIHEGSDKKGADRLINHALNDQIFCQHFVEVIEITEITYARCVVHASTRLF